MKLHVFPPSPNARRCVVTADLAGVEIEQVMVDLMAGEQKTPEFLALNPNGKMPVLEFADGSTLWESNAIVNRRADLGDSDLFPKSDARFQIVQWQFWDKAHWSPAVTAFIAEKFFDRKIDRDAATEELHKVAKVLDGQLSDRPWLLGGEMTVADISVAANLCYRDVCSIPLDGFNNIENWMRRLEDIPAWQRANPALESIG